MATQEKVSDAIVNVVRGCTRPILAIMFSFLWCVVYWNVLTQGGNLSDIDPAFTGLVWGWDGLWFGDRVLLKGKGLVDAMRGGLANGSNRHDGGRG